MRKLFIIVAIFALPFSSFAKEKEMKSFDLDAGVFFSYGIFDIDGTKDVIDTEKELVGLIRTLLSIRGGFSVTGRYRITQELSAGLEIGYATMSIEPDGGNRTVFTDIPLNALIRFGSGDTFIEGHAGYYVSTPVFAGASVGAKLCLSGFYIDGTYIFNNDLGNYPRITLGYQFNNLISKFL